MRLRALVFAHLALLVALAGSFSCTGDDGSPDIAATATPTATPTSTPGPSPTATPGPTPLPSPAETQIASVSVSPKEVAVGEIATVTVWVENTGDVSGTHAVELSQRGSIVQTKDVVVPPQSSRRVRFRISEEEPGLCRIEVGDLADVLEVKSGLYRDSTYGFSIEYPRGWESEVISERPPVVKIFEPLGPSFQLFVDVFLEELTAEEYARQFIEYMGSTPSFQIVVQREVALGGSTSGYEVVFENVQSGVQAKGSGVFVTSGAKGFSIVRNYERLAFDSTRSEVDDIVRTFTVEEPRPFGVPRSTGLFLFDTGPTTLDPAVARTTNSAEFIVQIFSGLATFDENMQTVPDLAERWDVSEDGTVYTFHLRHGATFHDGREVTASDIEYSIERACNPDTESATAEAYLGDIVGAIEMLNGEATDIAGIRVIDDYTIEITIDAAKAYFIDKLTHPASYVVDRHDVESGDEWWRSPNGTGPFSLIEWQEDALIVLESNYAFYDTPPAVEHVVFNLWGGNPMLMYETGEIDSTYVYLSDLERVLDPTNPLNQELSTVPTLSVSYVGFNCTRPPFDDPRIRQAFSHAIDKDKIVEVLLKGAVVRADRIVPPGMPGYDPDVQGLGYDPDAALQLIAESSYGSASNLPTITLTTYGRGTVGDLEAALIDMWRDDLGVEVEVRQLDPDVYFQRLMEEKDELFTAGWSADYPDPQNFLDVLFHTGLEQNTGEYSNPEVDHLLEQAQVEQDDTARMQLYEQIEQMIVDDAAWLPLSFSIDRILVKPYVEGLTLSPLGHRMLRNVEMQPR